MIRSPRWSPLAAFVAIVAIVFAACGGTTASTAPSSAASVAPTTAPASASAPAFTAMNYPETGEAPCGEAAAPDATHDKYGGEFKKISAPDARTVVFDLCGSDVAFLSKIAFSSFAINDAGWLASHIDPAATDNQKIVSEANGTGPYKVKAWNRGQDVTYEAYDGYWGTKALTPTAILRWNKEAAQRLVELQAGTVDGIDNVGPTDFATVQGDANLQLKPRTGLNVFYLGFNNTYKPWDNEAVRQAIAKGIDRKRIVDTFYPGGSEVADYFTPCDIPNGCVGPKWYDFDAAAAKQELTAAGFDFSKSYKLHFRPAVRGYLPDPPVIATEIQAQLKANLGITIELDQQDDTTYLDNAAAGLLDGIQMLGWGADYPDQTNFVGYHFGAGASKQFGDKYPDLVAALDEGAKGTSDAAREPAYTKVNELIKTHVPMIPIAHGGSAMAYRADVAGAHSSPLTNEQFAVMQAGDRPQLVFSQNGEPGGLYCADETDGEALRACDQTMEGLYGYEIGGTAAIPILADKCEPNADFTSWTCTLKSGVTFHDGSSFDADDVVTSFAVQWDADNPLHKGRTGDFTYFSSLFGGFLNPPVPAAS
jgi:peptide/nickel transport system substrate-binding protein